MFYEGANRHKERKTRTVLEEFFTLKISLTQISIFINIYIQIINNLSNNKLWMYKKINVLIIKQLCKIRLNSTQRSNKINN